MASLSDVSPAWCSPAAMLLANDRDGSLIIFVTEFVVVVLCLLRMPSFIMKLMYFFAVPSLQFTSLAMRLASTPKVKASLFLKIIEAAFCSQC